MISVRRKFTFEVAHSLPYHGGKCKKIHGHSYKLFVTVSRHNGLLDCGMVIDFSDLSNIVNTVISKYEIDHSYLNNIIYNPTAEKFIIFIANKLIKELTEFDSDLNLKKLELYETENCCAIWEEE